MTALWVLGAVFLVADGGSLSNCMSSQDGVVASYGTCVKSKARQFERSGERADEVATAAVSACLGQRNASIAGYATCLGDSMAREILDKADEVIRANAVEIVVTIRARRHSN